MLGLTLAQDASRPLHLLCIGAHSDDVEIGCGGSLMTWLRAPRPVHVTWVVLSGEGKRADEARRSACALLRRAASVDFVWGQFRDGFLPSVYAEVKAFFESLASRTNPDLILSHRLEDRHQDHRVVAELTWNTWRDHMILEYEIMKYEGDLGQPNLYQPLTATVAKRKAAHLARHFGSQRAKHWFETENFLALARLRALECRASQGFAEAFHARKLVFSPGGGA